MKQSAQTSLKSLPVQWISEIHGVRAASGLVKNGNDFYVVADDDLALAIFRFETEAKVEFKPLLSGKLPEDPVQRKKLKPDWESLTRIFFDEQPSALLAIPSGSTTNRQKGILIYFDERSPVPIDFSPLYEKLGQKYSELNIEGACFCGNVFKLFQRGNGPSGQNAVIDLDTGEFLKNLLESSSVTPNCLRGSREYDIGSVDGHRLDFTDACALQDSIWFLAVAENSSSTYEDGLYQGAILGCMDASGSMIHKFKIECPQKPEGLWVEAENNMLRFYIVTDADRADLNAQILQASLMKEVAFSNITE